MTQQIFARNIPNDCYTQIQNVHAAQAQVLSVAFSPSGNGWAVIPSTGSAVGGALPADCQQALASLQTGGAVVNCVAFTPQFGWFMSNTKGATSEHALPAGFDQTLKSQGGAAEVACVAFSSQGGWVVVNQKGQCANSSSGVPSDCLTALTNLTQTAGGVRSVAFTPGGGWVAIGDDGAWYGGDGVDPEAWMYLSYYSSLLGPLTFAAFTPGNGWTITSDATRSVLLPIENPAGHLDPLAVFQSLSGRLDNTTVGWAAMIGSASNITSFARGYARTAANPPEQLFLPSTKWQTASTSKVLTALTTIAIVDKLPKPPSGNALDIPISSYLPQGWQVANLVPEITFGELLSHTSGIPDEGGGWTYDQLHQYFQTVKLNPQKPELYSNVGYSLLRLLIPAAAGFNYAENAQPDPNTMFSNKYVELVNQYVFAPVGVTGMACEPPSGSDTYALVYQYPGTSPGYDWSYDNNLPLYLQAGPGGWWVSLEDMAPVMNNLSQRAANALPASAASILSSAQWEQMLHIVSGAATPYPNGWDQVDGSVPPNWIMKNGGVTTATNPPTNTTTVFAIFGTTTWGVAVANSDICGPNMQRGWQWCQKCTAMWYTAAGNGACPAGPGGHNGSSSWNYLLSTSSSEPGAQSDWRWCSSCESIWYAATSSTGHCVGTHAGHQSAGSSDYSINIAATGIQYPPDQQNGWMQCRNCLVLNLPGSVTGTSAAPLCASGVDHDNTGSKTYWLQSVPDVPTILQTAFQSGVRP
jgi:CubicO group peptidase (beta-lactamase class C family)